jgi:hypothetical protein
MRPRLPRSRQKWFFLCAGGALLVACLHSLWYGFTSESWPRVDAVMEVSLSHFPLSRLARVEVRYRYETGGRRYTGSRWRYKLNADVPDMFVSRAAMEVGATVASYPPGSTARVAVNPSDPGEAVLEPGISIDDQIFAVFGLALVAIAVLPGRGRHAAMEDARAAHPKKAKPAPRSAAGVITVLATIILLVGGYVFYRDAAGSVWPSVTGKVLYRLRADGSWSVPRRAFVRYEYVVNGTRYLGETGYSGTADDMDAWFAPLKIGTAISVRYNPLDHGDSVIESHITWRDFSLPAVALMLYWLAGFLHRRAVPAANGTSRLTS